jgi:phosphoglycerate dehydrogenase-like enzyme
VPAPTVVVTWPHAQVAAGSALDRLAQRGWNVVLHPKHGQRSAAEVEHLMVGANAAIVSTDPFPASTLAALPDLRVIARMGVGVDSIDVPAATAGGVLVTTTPGANHGVVAEHTVAMILALVRRLPENDASTKNGNWDRAGALTPRTLSAMTVGIVGMGRIGRSVATAVRGFGADVVYVDPAVDPDSVTDANRVDFDELLTRSNVISLHMPSTPDTRGLFNSEVFGRMKSGSLIVNAGRGDAIDEQALITALDSGHIAGAALDVFEREPFIPEQLRTMSNVILSPHTAALSAESIQVMMESAVSSIIAVLDGQIPDTAINPQAVESIHA